MCPNSNTDIVAKSKAIGGSIARLTRNPLNNLSNEAYRKIVKAGWDDQWLNWDKLDDEDDGHGWGDIGD